MDFKTWIETIPAKVLENIVKCSGETAVNLEADCPLCVIFRKTVNIKFCLLFQNNWS